MGNKARNKKGSRKKGSRNKKGSAKNRNKL
jgi:hypothetical protein